MSKERIVFQSKDEASVWAAIYAAAVTPTKPMGQYADVADTGLRSYRERAGLLNGTDERSP